MANDASFSLPILELLASEQLEVVSLDLSLPLFEIDAYARLGATANITLPSIEVSIRSGIGTQLELPGITISASGTADHIIEADITLPMFEVSGRSGHSASNDLPLIEVTSSAVVGEVGSLEKALPLLTVSATGTSPIIGRASITLPALTASGGQEQRISVTASISIPTITVAAAGYTGVVAEADITIPLATITATGSFAPSGTANVVLPLFVLESSVTGTVIITSQVADDEESDSFAISFNLVGKGITEYRNYKFNSFAYFGGKYLGVNESGLYEMEGEDDAGTDIQATIRTGLDSLDNYNLKRCWGAYISHNCNFLGTSIITEPEEQYTVPGPKNRSGFSVQKFGVSRRLRSTYWGLEIENLVGGDFTIDDLQLVLEVLGRRVA